MSIRVSDLMLEKADLHNIKIGCVDFSLKNKMGKMINIHQAVRFYFILFVVLLMFRYLGIIG